MVTQASTDQGNVSHALPSLHTNFWIESEGGGPHTADFERAARSEHAYVMHLLPVAIDEFDGADERSFSHDRAMRVAKALAATAVDVLTQPSLLEEVKREFRDSELR